MRWERRLFGPTGSITSYFGPHRSSSRAWPVDLRNASETFITPGTEQRVPARLSLTPFLFLRSFFWEPEVVCAKRRVAFVTCFVLSPDLFRESGEWN